ncbi:MAG TPA: SpoIIE family protein phosphatase [bacterium]|nr:SpoIIE family protein phosphatase [bacterium]HPN42552.1 SpoIIE family protein phosphatase [bacterium]
MFKSAIKEQLQVPADVDHLGHLRDFVTRIGKKHGFSERSVNAFKLSIDEAATNIIKHAYRDWDGDIIIRALVRKNSLTFILIDKGKYFDPRQVKDPDLKKYVDIGKKGGLGIFMMRRLLDRIDYRKTEVGNELWLTKNREEKKRGKISVAAIPIGMKARYWLISMAFFTALMVMTFMYFFLKQDDKVLSEYIENGKRACSVLANDIAKNLTDTNDINDEVLNELITNGSQDLVVLNKANTSVNTLLKSEHSDILFNALVIDNIQNILAIAYEDSFYRVLGNYEVPGKKKKIQENVYQYRLKSGAGVIDVEWPVQDDSGRTLCTSHFLMDYNKISKDTTAARSNYLRLLLLIWILVAASLFLLIYLLMNPFRRLQEWVKDLGQPGIAEELDIDTSTEVGEIAKAFSDITMKLRDSQANQVEQERLQKEMQVAQEIQQTLLPANVPEVEGYEIASYYAAAKEVGGDYFDFVEVDSDTLGIVVADVSGKGVPGSLVMTMIRTALRTEARGIKDAAEVLTRVNDFVVNDMKKGMFVTLFYVIIDSKKRRINFASAGHNPMILYRPSQQKTYYLNPRGFPIGISLPEKDLFKRSLQSDTLALAEDDILLVYTDGITEAMNARREMFGEERFLNVIRDSGTLKAEEFIEKLQKEINSFTEGSPQNDDITLVAIKEQTSVEKIELKRAKNVFNHIQQGMPLKEACKLERISTYSYYHKYKEKFEKEGLESYVIEQPSEDLEFKHLSIEEKAKIFDVIRRFPDYGAKRISEELNTEHYNFTVISPARIYDELVNSRLNTKKLRDAFVLRGTRKKRLKTPGTPLLTIDGQVIVDKQHYIESTPEPKAEKPAEPAPINEQIAETQPVKKSLRFRVKKQEKEAPPEIQEPAFAAEELDEQEIPSSVRSLVTHEEQDKVVDTLALMEETPEAPVTKTPQIETPGPQSSEAAGIYDLEAVIDADAFTDLLFNEDKVLQTGLSPIADTVTEIDTPEFNVLDQIAEPQVVEPDSEYPKAMNEQEEPELQTLSEKAVSAAPEDTLQDLSSAVAIEDIPAEKEEEFIDYLELDFSHKEPLKMEHYSQPAETISDREEPIVPAAEPYIKEDDDLFAFDELTFAGTEEKIELPDEPAPIQAVIQKDDIKTDFSVFEEIEEPAQSETLAEQEAIDDSIDDMDLVGTKTKFRLIEEEEIELADIMNTSGDMIQISEADAKMAFSDEDIEDINVISETGLYESPANNPEPFTEFVSLDQVGKEPVNRISGSKGEAKPLELVNEQFDFSIPFDDIWEIKEVHTGQTITDTLEFLDQDKLSFEELIDMVGGQKRESDNRQPAPKGQSASLPKPDINQQKETLLRDKLITRAVKLYSKENYNEAIKIFCNLLAAYPNDVSIHGYLGNAYFRNKNYPQAIIEYETVLKLDSSNPQACENLGVVYANQGNLSKAIEQWEKLLSLTPDREDINKSIKRAKKYLVKS